MHRMTKGPTGAPNDSVTDAPVASPTVGPTVAPVYGYPPIEHCPDELEMVSTDVILSPGLENLIEIVDRTDSTATFQVTNPSNQPLDVVYVQTYNENFDVPCTMMEQFQPGQVSTHTALCMETTSKTMVTIWIGDNSVPGSNDATIPICCGEAYPGKTLKVVYELKCDCEHEFECPISNICL